MKSISFTYMHACLERLDALSIRERLSLFLAALVGIVTLLVLGIILPAREETRRLRADTAQLQAQIRAMQAELTRSAVSANPAVDIAVDLARYEALLAEPQKINAAVRHLLPERSGLRLKSLSLEPGRPLFTASAEAAAEQPMAAPQQSGQSAHDEAWSASTPVSGQGNADHSPTWYAQGITLELEGGYAALTLALQRLERLPWLVERRAVRLDASEHPRIRMRVELAAIGRQATWINR